MQYIPNGNETGVTIIGETKSPAIPDQHLKAIVLQGLEVASEEDRENLKEL